MSAPPPVTMPTAVMTTAPVSRLPKFTASSSRLTKPALTPKNSTSAAAANATAANANANGDMGQAASVNAGQFISSTTSRLNIGFYHHSVSNSGIKTGLINGKQNGFIRAPTNFTAKWRKENVEDASADFEYKSGQGANGKKSLSNFTGKTQALNQNAVSSPKVIPKAGKVAPKSTLNCLAKKQNGGCLSKTRSVSPLEVKKQVAGRSHSSDSIGAAQSGKLATSDKVRSRSLTQVQRQPSPTAASPAGKSRAYSTNRAERKAGNTAAAASMLPTAMMKKPLVPRQNGIGNFKVRTGIFKEAGPIRVQNEPKRNQRRNSVETPSDNSPGSSPEAPDSRGLPSRRGSQNEVSMLGETLEDMSLSSTSSLDRHDTSQEYMDDFDNLGNGGGALLTSCAQNDDDDSGLDRSRFHDDEGRMVVDGISTAADLCFLDDGLDWNHIRLSGDHALRRLSRRRRSSQPDHHSQCGSSLDLSPSDSCGSGGTFLWDEEVEPLGGAVQIPAPLASVRTHPVGQNGVQTKRELDRSQSLCVGSLHSDVSSIDVLNDLESCDLDEDDLMLDVDFPEDHSLTSDGGSYMAEWRRRQLCWGTHNDTDSEFHTDRAASEEQRNGRKDSELSLDLRLSGLKSCSALGPGLGLGLDVEELVEDCSALRSQLEHLQKVLLLQEDEDEDTLTTDTLSPETESSSDGTETQVEVLLQEVLHLREEVRTRDRTIAELSQQLSAVPAVSRRCHCQDMEKTEVQTQTRETEKESAGSQTPWNQSTPAILQSNQSLPDTLTSQSGSPSASEAPPSDRVTIAAAEDRGKRTALPSKLRLFMFPGSSHCKSTSSSSPASKRKPAHSMGGRGKPGPAPSCPSPLVSRLPKPKTH